MRRKMGLVFKSLVAVTLLFSSAVAFADSVDSFNAWIEVKSVAEPASLSFTSEPYTEDDLGKDPSDSSLALEGSVDLTADNGYESLPFYASARTSTRAATNLKVEFGQLKYNNHYIPLTVTYTVGETSNIVTANSDNQTQSFTMKEAADSTVSARPLSYKIVVSVDEAHLAAIPDMINGIYSTDFRLTFDTEG